MDESTSTATNPYRPSTLDDPPAPLLVVREQTNTGGRLWTPCRHHVTADRVEMTFLTQKLTLPIESITLLRSGGRGLDRYLEIIHNDSLTPDTIKVLPLFPAKWFDVFESLGIPTLDEASLRESKQLHYRSSEWVSTIEGLIWMAVVLAAFAAGAISWLLG
jgi:hypothetical protein